MCQASHQMATPLNYRPLAASTPLSHLSGVNLSYSEQIHPVLSCRGKYIEDIPKPDIFYRSDRIFGP